MASYIAVLTPALVNPGTEGSMDEHLVNGKSIQRTAYFEVFSSTNRKIVEVVDGGTFTDTIATFAENVNIDSA